MMNSSILLNNIIVANAATGYQHQGGDNQVPSWGESSNDYMKTLKVDSCYRSGSTSEAWKAGSWDEASNKIHTDHNFDARWGWNTELQYMAVDFEAYAIEYNSEEVSSSWNYEDWENADEDILRRSLQPLLDDCAAKCWMQDDCEYAYGFVRKHYNGIDGDSPVFVKGYQDLLDFKNVHQTVVFYCHMFNETKGEYWKVHADTTGVWNSEFKDEWTKDGDNIVSLIYQKPEATEGFCGDNLCPYTSSVEKYHEGVVEYVVMSDPLSRTVEGSDFAQGLNIFATSTFVTLKEVQDMCLADDKCVAVDFTMIADHNEIGEQLYDAQSYGFVSNEMDARNAILSYHEAGSVHMNDYFLPVSNAGDGMMIKLSPCRAHKNAKVYKIKAVVSVQD